MPTALLIIDVQNAVLAGQAAAERQQQVDAALDGTVMRLQVLQARARACGIPVVMVQHNGEADHRLATGTNGWAIRRELTPAPGEAVVQKTSCDSFYRTDLAERLAAHSTTHLVIGGCMTQFCVDTTVRRAVTLGYNVTLIADGHTTADGNGLTFSQIVDHHNATLDGFDAGTNSVTVRPAEQIEF